jgi:hypothetical protein
VVCCSSCPILHQPDKTQKKHKWCKTHILVVYNFYITFFVSYNRYALRKSVKDWSCGGIGGWFSWIVKINILYNNMGRFFFIWSLPTMYADVPHMCCRPRWTWRCICLVFSECWASSGLPVCCMHVFCAATRWSSWAHVVAWHPTWCVQWRVDHFSAYVAFVVFIVWLWSV